MNMQYKYLNKNYKNPEQLRKDYLGWAKVLHSDHGGNDEDMKLLNRERDERLKEFSVFKHATKQEIWTFIRDGLKEAGIAVEPVLKKKANDLAGILIDSLSKSLNIKDDMLKNVAKKFANQKIEQFKIEEFFK